MTDLKTEIYLAIKDFCKNNDSAEWAACTATKLVEEKFKPTNSTMDAICGQKLSCRFQHFSDKIRCGAPSVIDCRHKQH
jgi:hypothetical protein